MNDKEFLKQNTGLDISKDEFDATIVAMDKKLNVKKLGSRKFSNNPNGWDEFFKWEGKKSVIDNNRNITMEATGVYYENLAYYLHEKDVFSLHVVLPNLSKKFTQSLGQKSKTDQLDADALAHMGIERNLRTWAPASENIRELKGLTRERNRYLKDRTRTKNQLHAHRNQKAPSAATTKRLEDLIAFLNNAIKQVEKEIHQLINKDQVLKDKVQKLLSTPGVGMATVACVIAETNGFASIYNMKQLQSFAGYDVKLRQSGKWKGQSKISKQGNSHIRAALYFPAYTIIKHSDYHRSFYNRLLEKKQKSKIAATAVQRKLLALMFTLWKKDEYFDPEKANNKAVAA